jgi:hypothetical protein
VLRKWVNMIEIHNNLRGPTLEEFLGILGFIIIATLKIKF